MSFTAVPVYSLTKPATPPQVDGVTFVPDGEFGIGLWMAAAPDQSTLDALLDAGFYSRAEIEECKAVADAYASKLNDMGIANAALTAAVAATTAAGLTDLGANADVVTALAAKIAADDAKTAADAAAATADAAKTAADAAYSGAFATGTLTSTGTAPSDGDIVHVGAKDYTLKTALTPTEGEVLIGDTTDASAALANLKSAMNHTGTPNTDYKCAAVHPTIAAGALTATTLVLTAKSAGAGGDSLATTEVSTELSFGRATLLRDPALATAAAAADSAATAADATAATADSDATAADTAYTDAVAAAAADLTVEQTARATQASAVVAYAAAIAAIIPGLGALLNLGTRRTGKRNPFPTREFTMSPFPITLLSAQMDFGPDGFIYACANNFGTDMSIKRINPDTGEVTTFFTSTLLDSQVNDVRWGADGQLYLIGINVGDTKHYLEVVDAAGTHVSQQNLTDLGMDFPAGIEVNADASAYYLTDITKQAVYKLTLGGVLTVLAGTVDTPGAADGTGTAASFHGPLGIAFTADFGALIVTDGQNQSVRQITVPGGVVTTVAGPSGAAAGTAGFVDGEGAVARFNVPQYLCRIAGSSNSGLFVIPDNVNGAIRLLDLNSGTVSTLPQVGVASYGQNGAAAMTRNGEPFIFVVGDGYLHKL
jgi:hypothetical protein